VFQPFIGFSRCDIIIGFEEVKTLKKFLNDFKAFAIKGNIVDLAVAVIIGGAFGKIVTSLVNDLIMPVIGAIFSVPDFSALTVTINEAPIMIGLFIQAVIDFLIVAMAVFIMIRFLARFKKKEEVRAEILPIATKEEVLLAEIRDILKEKNQA